MEISGGDLVADGLLVDEDALSMCSSGMIRRLWTENPRWGEDRIAGELRKLGYKASPKDPALY
jgi:hypothetical protein